MKIQKIRAAVLRQRGGPLKIETVEMEGPRQDEILVRIVASGICHTDIGFCDGWDLSDGPLILGHEGSGVVEEVGETVKAVKPGDHVLLSYQSCGRCRECRKGHPSGCERLYEVNFGFQRVDGSSAFQASGARGHFFGQSSFASHCLATERNVVKISKDLPLDLLAPLGCGIQTGAGTIMNSLAVRKGKSIAVFGTGAVGLAAVMAASLVGAKPIIAVDIVPSRLELALELGATHRIDSRREELGNRVREISGAGVDYVLEITGDPAMDQIAAEVLKPKGTIALIASPSGPASLPGGRKVIPIVEGDAVPQKFLPKIIRLFLAGKFPFDRLVRFYSFGRINQAIRDAKRGKTIKPVLQISKV